MEIIESIGVLIDFCLCFIKKIMTEYKAYQHLSHMIMEYPGYRIA